MIQLTLLEAVQEQPLGEVTLTDPVPPAEVKDWLVGGDGITAGHSRLGNRESLPGYG